MAEAELFATPAGTWRIGSAPSHPRSRSAHHVGRRPVPLQQLRHGLHRGAGMGEEQLKARAQVVLSRLAVDARAQTDPSDSPRCKAASPHNAGTAR